MSWNTHIPKFRRFVLQNFPFIEQDFDALTDYELICKVVEYLNSVITSQNEVIAEVGRFETDVTNQINTFETNVNNEINTFETNITNDFNRLEGLFNELQSFVDNYFENLDVQEEINNKLDEMAEDGTLQEIITQYINSTALWMFDNVAGMKLATNLINGSYAKTLGFYDKNDKGGSYYKIRTKTENDTANEMTLIDLYDNTLIAELVKTDIMNVKQFGAVGDENHDDTLNIQTALNNCASLIVPTGTYMVNAVTRINLNTGNKLTLDNDATIKAITNDSTNYEILYINNATDVEISGGTIEGDRLTHTGETGEWGHCIKVHNSSDNVYIHDISLINAWGDGLDLNTTGSVRTERVHVKNARRNGYSIGAVNIFSSTDDVIEDTNGTAPQCGVDIEPDNGTQVIKDVIFTNLLSKNNSAQGFIISGNVDNVTPSNIKLVNCHVDGNTNGIWVECATTYKGKLEIIDPLITNCKSRGMLLRPKGMSFAISIIRPCIDKYGVETANQPGIYIQGLDNTTCGNIFIKEPVIINKNVESTNKYDIQIYGSTTTFDKLYIIDPVKLDGNVISFNSPSADVKFTDKYGLLNSDVDEATVLGGSYSVLSFTTSNYTELQNIRISSSARIPIGYKVKFINTGDYGIKIQFQNQYIYGITNTVNKTVTSTDKGAYLEILKISSTEWTVLSKSGTFTTN